VAVERQKMEKLNFAELFLVKSIDFVIVRLQAYLLLFNFL